ncbi:integrase [Kitasatospora sp. GP82]|uniref:tyrosine-type recombinase/integrase n=1 Tax=Kitasatospora sp. GP82 TaxID=3035089 RepID=UPI002473968D|nr:integrase [Kitasatospora sp. GP82]MDH6129863.1 site-specific recombinase XerD [Kitasatospora sp. GP82]
MPREPRPLLAELTAGVDMAAWLEAEGIADGTPYLMCPDGTYDIQLNSYWLSPEMTGSSRHTKLAAARDLKSQLNFLWNHRPPVPAEGPDDARPRSWRDATERDREAYEVWRCDDPAGPRVDASTWNRELTTVNGVYTWAVRKGFVEQNPIAQRPKRDHRPGRRLGQTPTARRPDARRGRVDWLPPATYRAFRDVGIRGYLPTGLKDPTFRGKRTARNAAYADLMIRTGHRLEEQSALTLYEVPDHDGTRAYYDSWLPPAIAKNGSCRDIYWPDSVLRSLGDYIEIDRADAVAAAQAAGRYEQILDPLIIEDPHDPRIWSRDRWRDVADLDAEERLRLLVRTPDGLEPAMLWLGEDGMPLTLDAWKWVFREASKRCRRLGLKITCHAHALRHSFAVITLEQLQRAHLTALGAMTPQQRRHYTLIWGDPLDWVRIRLGHASLETTQTYLHCLKSLEMETRLALVPDLWEHPDKPYLDAMARAVEEEECLSLADTLDLDEDGEFEMAWCPS